MSTFAGFFGILLSVCLLGRTAGDCDSEINDIQQRCLTQFNTLAAQPPLDSAELQTFCRNASAALTCLESYQCSPNNSNYLKHFRFTEVLKSDRYLCSSTARQVYLKDGRCLWDALNVSSSAAAQRCDTNAFLKLQSSSNATKCRGFNYRLQCQRNVVRDACSQDIASVWWQFVQKRPETLHFSFQHNCSIERPNSACYSYEIMKCIANVQRELPTSATAFESFCRNSSAALACLGTIQCASNHDFYTEWLWKTGTLEANQYLCSDNVRQVYLQEFHCARNTSADERVQQDCYSASRADLQSSSNITKCRGFNNQLRCQYNAVRSGCSQDAATLHVEYSRTQSKRFHSALFKCILDTSYTSGFGRMTSSMTSLVVLFIITLILTRG